MMGTERFHLFKEGKLPRVGMAIQACTALFMTASTCFPAADSLRSALVKEAIPFQQRIYSPTDNSFLTLQGILILIQRANAGNPLAQQELGWRYLMGKNFPADTLKAVYWTETAANANLASARYNLGIFLNNGWGIPWNPFKAYKHFQYAAAQGMKEAQYNYGLMQTDNLVVQRNFHEALYWVSLSAAAGYPPAKEALAEFYKRGIGSPSGESGEQGTDQTGPSKNNASASSAPSRHSSPDSVVSFVETDEADDETLLKDALLEHGPDHERQDPAIDGGAFFDKNADEIVAVIRKAAAAGSPEALALLGRWHETGRLLDRNEMLASVYYLRAVRNNSPRAPVLLQRLIQKSGYFDRLKIMIGNNDPAAKFAWAALVSFGFDRQLTEAQALSFFEESAADHCCDALVELGLMAYSGKWVARDPGKGKTLLKRAAEAGDREAQVRLWMIELNDGGGAALADSLRRAGKEGSVFAQAMLGYCYRKGLGVDRNIPRSVYFYRKAAQRGSRAASIALREMVDEIRPEDPEFRITE